MPEPKQGPASAAPAAEPLSAILAEMRADRCIPHHIDWADRIEAAAEREYEEAKAYFEKLHDGPSMICTAKNCAMRNVGLAIANAAPGNAAAMRAALVECAKRIGMHVVNFKTGVVPPDAEAEAEKDENAHSRAFAALAAPARNCDRFATALEAANAWQAYSVVHRDRDYSLMAAFNWLFATAEGGEK